MPLWAPRPPSERPFTNNYDSHDLWQARVNLDWRFYFTIEGATPALERRRLTTRYEKVIFQLGAPSAPWRS